ncbi:MAG TPA: 5'/3'-nucleotidase SurE [Vicinamibacterales bacterium]|jgi:5'-nucleotidase
MPSSFRPVYLILVVLLLACVLAPLRAQQRPQPPPYRILISNDDGVRAQGLAIVAQTLQAIGQVIIVAPAENQSGKGHSIVTTEPVFRSDLTLPNGLKAISLTATPATTVNIAISNIVTPKPDLVVSGINRGLNLGYASYLSGTVGAARQGAMMGVPAIATALAEAGTQRDYVFAAEEVLGVARRVKQWGLPPNTFLSVNIPIMPADGFKGYMITTQAMQNGGKEFFVETKHPSGRSIYWNQFEEGGTAPQGTDIWAVSNGYVSVTPMKVGETDLSQMDALRAIFK